MVDRVDTVVGVDGVSLGSTVEGVEGVDGVDQDPLYPQNQPLVLNYNRFNFPSYINF